MVYGGGSDSEIKWGAGGTPYLEVKVIDLLQTF